MAENMIKFLRGNVASLPQTATAGAVYFTKDEGLYLGLEDGSYHRYGDFITVADVASLPETGAHETCMYYCESENILAKWDGSDWVQINKQKTLAELGGVAKSVYEAKMAALEKADTDNATAVSNLSSYVGTIPETATATNIVAYVQEKTAGIATDAALGELTGRVTAAEGEIDVLQAAIAEGGSVALAIADAKKAGTDAAAAAKAAQDTADSKATMAEVEAKNYATKSEAEGYANAKDEAIAAAKAAGDAAQADVDALELKVGTVAEGKTVVKMIEEAQAAATYDDTQVKADIKANSDAIDAIEADYLKAADKTELSNAIAAEADRADKAEKANAAAIKAISDDYLKAEDKAALQSQIDTIMSNPDAEGAINSINEFTQYVKDHGTIAEGFRTDINANAAAIEAIEADYLKAEDKTALQGAIDGVAGRMTTAEGEIDALQAASHTHANETVLGGITAEKVAAWDAAEANAKTHADGLNSAMDTRVLALEAIDHEHANKAELDLIASGDKAKWDAAAAKAHEHTFVESELNLIKSGDVAKWNAAQANAEATAAAALSAAKTELEGKITAEATTARAAEKANADAIAIINGSGEGSIAKALADAKAYADTAEADAVTAANAYTDSALTWGSF